MSAFATRVVDWIEDGAFVFRRHVNNLISISANRTFTVDDIDYNILSSDSHTTPRPMIDVFDDHVSCTNDNCRWTTQSDAYRWRPGDPIYRGVS